MHHTVCVATTTYFSSSTATYTIVPREHITNNSSYRYTQNLTGPRPFPQVQTSQGPEQVMPTAALPPINIHVNQTASVETREVHYRWQPGQRGGLYRQRRGTITQVSWVWTKVMNSYVGDVISKDIVKGTVQTIHEYDQQESGNRGAQRSLGEHMNQQQQW